MEFFALPLPLKNKNKNKIMASTKAQEETAEASQLVAREIASAINTPKLLEDHLKVTKKF